MKNFELIFESENIQYVKLSEDLINEYLTMVNDPEVANKISHNMRTFTYEEEQKWVRTKLEENAICYSRSDFEGRKNIKDLFYLSISWIFFEIEFNTNYYNYKQKWIKRIKKLYYSRCFPNFMRQTIYTIYKRRKNKK